MNPHNKPLQAWQRAGHTSETLQTDSVTPALRAIVSPARRVFARQLLVSGAVATGMALLGSVEALAQGRVARSKRQPLAEIPAAAKQEGARQTRSWYAAHLSETFQTTDGLGTPVLLQLFAVSDLPQQQASLAKRNIGRASVDKLREASFALTFRGSVDTPLQQNTFRLRHQTMGELLLFLVPVGPVEKDAAWRDYVAVFNREVE